MTSASGSRGSGSGSGSGLQTGAIASIDSEVRDASYGLTADAAAAAAVCCLDLHGRKSVHVRSF